MAKRLGMLSVPELAYDTGGEHFNTPPSWAVPTGYRDVGDSGALDIRAMRWGFVPSWTTDTKVQPINMRLDKSDGKFWRKAVQRRRAVVPVDWW